MNHPYAPIPLPAPDAPVPRTYTPRFAARDQDITLRGLRHRVHYWGDPAAPVVVLLHGWVDTGMSFQFLADELAPQWYLVAPDWRGFGDTEHAPGGYWFPDYLADLDALLDLVSPGAPARIVGHSMGGNVAWLHAGVRPERVSHVASLDAAGIPDTRPDAAPDRYARWLEQLRSPASFATLPDEDAVLALVRRLAPRLEPARQAFIAGQWARPDGQGAWKLPHDPRHKHVNPVLYRRSEASACWQRIRARALLVLAREARTFRDWEGAQCAQISAAIPQLEVEVLDGGHMLHLEQPAALARILGDFLSAS